MISRFEGLINSSLDWNERKVSSGRDLQVSKVNDKQMKSTDHTSTGCPLFGQEGGKMNFIAMSLILLCSRGTLAD